MLTEDELLESAKITVNFMAQPSIEGLRLKPYLCPAGKPTIGIGSTFYEDGTPVKLTDPAITQERAFSLALSLVQNHFQKTVLKYWPEVQNKYQLAALSSFAYNVGEANFAASTLLKKLKAGDIEGAANQFSVWTKATNPKTGKKEDLPGLVTRRGMEKTLFQTQA